MCKFEMKISMRDEYIMYNSVVQPLLGLFHIGLNVIVPLQVLGDGAAQESE